MESISDIKLKLAQTEDSFLPQVISLYADDERGGVQKLLDAARKRHEKYLIKALSYILSTNTKIFFLVQK